MTRPVYPEAGFLFAVDWLRQRNIGVVPMALAQEIFRRYEAWLPTICPAIRQSFRVIIRSVIHQNFGMSN